MTTQNGRIGNLAISFLPLAIGHWSLAACPLGRIGCQRKMNIEIINSGFVLS